MLIAATVLAIIMGHHASYTLTVLTCIDSSHTIYTIVHTIIIICFRSKKHEFIKSPHTTNINTTLELGQRNCYNALANPTYATIEGILDEDVQAKIQADS